MSKPVTEAELVRRGQQPPTTRATDRLIAEVRQKDAEIARLIHVTEQLREILHGNGVYDSTGRNHWSEEAKQGHRDGWGPKGCEDKYCPLCQPKRKSHA
jgi:hypothetical protein